MITSRKGHAVGVVGCSFHRDRALKILQEVEDETAKIISPSFNDTVWLNKAHSVLKELVTPLNEGRFKSLVLVLNGRIKHCLKLLSGDGLLNTTKIFTYIIELDTLISEGMELPRTPSLDHFQSYAKGILFRSIGDTFLILHNSHKGDKFYEELYYASYSVAYDIFHKASPIPLVLSAIFILETLSLRTLLKHFNAVKLSKNTAEQVGERLYAACKGKSTVRTKSFMLSFSSVPYNNPERHFVEQSEIARMVILSDKDNFLTSLLWLMAFNKDVAMNASFLDPFLKNLHKGNFNDDLQSFTESSLCKTDVKVLLLSAAQWCKLSIRPEQLNLGILPPVVFTQPSYMMLKFWELVITPVIKDTSPYPSQHCIKNGLIISALEVSRLRGEIPDLRIVDVVRKWLITNGSEIGDVVGNWAKLYSRVFMDSVNGFHYTSGSVLTEDLFFPPLVDSFSIKNDYDMLDDADIWFAPRSPLVSQKDEVDQYFDERSRQAQQKKDNAAVTEIEVETNLAVKTKSLSERLNKTLKNILLKENLTPLFSPHISKSSCIKALRELNKRSEIKYNKEAEVGRESSGNWDSFLPVNNNKIEETLYANIARLQNDHAAVICSFVQVVNSLQEKVKQLSTDLSVSTTKMYRQGYGDGFYAALQAGNVYSSSVLPYHSSSEAQENEKEINSRDQVHESFTQLDHRYNPKECFGCASEEDQDRVMKILDNLADDGSMQEYTVAGL